MKYEQTGLNYCVKKSQDWSCKAYFKRRQFNTNLFFLVPCLSPVANVEVHELVHAVLCERDQ